MAAQHFDSSLPYEEQIASYIKKAGSDGPALTVEGKRICRFTLWDQSGTMVDSPVSHDNVEEVKAFNAVKTKSSAKLPA